MAPKLSQDTLIHCETCGEDYSSTYRSCPFCGARNDPRRTSGRSDPKSSSRYIPTPPPAREPRDNSQDELDDTYIFDGQDAFDEDPDDEYYAPRSKGGKRLAPKGSGGFEMPPVNWPRLITFLCSLVIIVAALIIVFTSIYPQLHGSKDKDKDKDKDANNSSDVSPSVDPTPFYTIAPDPIDTNPVDPTDPPVDTPPVSEPPVPTANTGTPATVINASSGLRVRSGPGTSYEIVASLYNGNNITVIAPADNGWYNISFTGGNGTTITGYIMGDYISTISGGGSTTTTTTTTTTTPPPSSSSGGPRVGRTGTIVNASGGLRVRSGPGTSYDIVASLLNGNTVTVVSDAGSGWYEITFTGSGGSALRGYIMGDYISTN